MAQRLQTRFITFFACLAVSAGAMAASPQNDGRKPLMIVRFNQEHVYYGRALKQAVNAAEQAKPGAVYQVVSVAPSSKKAAHAVSPAQAKANLAAVTGGMAQLGIDASRIHSHSESSGAVSSQEVRIYVD